MNIIECMNDDALFGKTFRRNRRDADTWEAWRAFLAALFGLALKGEALEIFTKHTGRSDRPTEPFSECWCVCGRRSGKSLIAAMIAVYVACFRDYTPCRAPGEMLVLPIIAPDRRQCRIILGYVNGFLDTSPTLSSMVVARLKESVELSNGVRVEVHTANFRTVRGYTAVGCVIDEAAFLRSEDSATPDTELLAAITPAMSTIPGALLLAISSPYARKGELWRNYSAHFGKNDSPVLVWQAETRAMNPTVSRLTIDIAYVRDRASASAEFGAQFRSDIEGFLPMEAVEACVIPRRFELLYSSRHSYVGFVDPSGGANDAMTLGIAHGEAEKAVLDVVREMVPPFSPESVVAEFAGLLKAYHIHEVTGDAYSGEWVREQFQKSGVSYRVSETNRSEIYLEFLAAMMSGRVELLDHNKLVSQLCGLERRTGRGGRDSIDHGPGGHDDVANACAGALVRALGSMGNHGLLEYFGKLQSGEIPFPQEQIAVQRDWRQELAEWQHKGRTLLPSNPERFKAKSLPPCEKCSGTVVQLGGAQRCQACGYQPDGGTYIVAGRSTDGRPIFRELKHARARTVRNDT